MSMSFAGSAVAQTRTFDVASGNAVAAIPEFARQAGLQIVAPAREIRGVRTPAIRGSMDARAALGMLLQGTNLEVASDDGRIVTLRKRRPTTFQTAPQAQVVPASLQSQTEILQGGGAARPDVRGSGFDEIIVTARKQEEDIQSVPIAVTAITSEQLEQKAVFSAMDLQENVPALRVISAGPALGAQFSLRGLRSNGVVSYMSEVPIPTVAVTNSMFDLAAVQILSGPQGTLFGRNSTAGIIMFQPNLPKDTFEGSISLRAGNYSLWGVEWMLNVPLAPGLSVRAAGDLLRRKGYTRIVPNPVVPSVPGNSRLDEDRHDGQRLSIRVEPGDALTNDLLLYRHHSNQATSASKLIGTRACPAAPSLAEMFSLPACVYKPPLTTTAGLPDWDSEAARELALGNRETSNQFTGKIRVKAEGLLNTTLVPIGDEWEIKNIFGTQRQRTASGLDVDGTNLPVVTLDLKPRDSQTSDELQLRYNSSDGRLRAIVGGFYNRTKNRAISNSGILKFSLGGSDIVSDSTTRTQSKAVFLQATYAVTDRLNLTGGYRHSWDKTTFLGISLFNGACTTAPDSPLLVDPANCVRGQKLKEDEPSWTVSLDYRISDGALVYFTTRRGYNQGGFNSVDARPTYSAEKLTDFEAGVKADWNLGSIPVRTNLAVYQSRYRDIQRTVLLFVDNRPNGLILNAAKAKVNGVELQVNARLIEDPGAGRLALDSFVSYIDPKYQEFPYETAPGTFIDLTSNALAQAPKVTANAGLTYGIPVPESVAQDLSFRASWAYSSKYYYSDINNVSPLVSNKLDPFDRQGGYSLINLTLDAKRIGGIPLDMQFYVKNLTKKDYTTNRFNNLATLGSAVATYGAPRTFGVDMVYRFD